MKGMIVVHLAVSAAPLVHAEALFPGGVQPLCNQGWPLVLSDVRKALNSTSAVLRQGAIQIVAWEGDKESLEKLRAMQSASGSGRSASRLGSGQDRNPRPTVVNYLEWRLMNQESGLSNPRRRALSFTIHRLVAGVLQLRASGLRKQLQ